MNEVVVPANACTQLLFAERHRILAFAGTTA